MCLGLETEKQWQEAFYPVVWCQKRSVLMLRVGVWWPDETQDERYQGVPESRDKLCELLS
jgi:hypothetical protein